MPRLSVGLSHLSGGTGHGIAASVCLGDRSVLLSEPRLPLGPVCPSPCSSSWQLNAPGGICTLLFNPEVLPRKAPPLETGHGRAGLERGGPAPDPGGRVSRSLALPGEETEERPGHLCPHGVCDTQRNGWWGAMQHRPGFLFSLCSQGSTWCRGPQNRHRIEILRQAPQTPPTWNLSCPTLARLPHGEGSEEDPVGGAMP